MLKFLLAIVTGLVGAGVLHILLILILPFNSNVDAFGLDRRLSLFTMDSQKLEIRDSNPSNSSTQ